MVGDVHLYIHNEATGRFNYKRLIVLAYRGLVGRCDEADRSGSYDVTSEGHRADPDGYPCWFKVCSSTLSVDEGLLLAVDCPMLQNHLEATMAANHTDWSVPELTRSRRSVRR